MGRSGWKKWLMLKNAVDRTTECVINPWCSVLIHGRRWRWMCAPIWRSTLVTTEAIHGVPSVWMTGCGRRDIRLLEFLVKLRTRVRSRLLIDCATVIWRDSICILIGLVGFSTATHRREISGRKEGKHPARRPLSAHERFRAWHSIGPCFDLFWRIGPCFEIFDMSSSNLLALIWGLDWYDFTGLGTSVVFAVRHYWLQDLLWRGRLIHSLKAIKGSCSISHTIETLLTNSYTARLHEFSSRLARCGDTTGESWLIVETSPGWRHPWAQDSLRLLNESPALSIVTFCISVGMSLIIVIVFEIHKSGW